MRTITGNILDTTSGIICHQTNCRKVAGAGLALQIRKKWPKWYDFYLESPATLGFVSFFSVAPSISVVSLYAQNSYGRGQRHTDYDALRECLKTVSNIAAIASQQVYIPFGLGSGLGGGEWSVVSKIIEDELPYATIVKQADK